ncbi:MAG: formate dehydrogenase accessory sulfurtransferase FdhD [Proteobacteria bacterium]|nr:formate dehydrogenase accessory sulfurtransferase FdhD [Pseudomonadota bacterium]
MSTEIPFGEMIPYTITRYRDNHMVDEETVVAVEIPLTFVVNGHEIATLMCTPSHLKAYTYGFLFTSGLIKGAEDILAYDCNEKKWRVDVTVKHFVDPELLGQRVYTSGCGKGVMYTSMMELSARHPIDSQVRIDGQKIIAAMHWLQNCSDLHNQTGGVHSAAVSLNGDLPQFHIDDIGRHNAVDKIIGTLMLNQTPSENLVLLSTGRISSEILHKARRLCIPVLASRGAPTHQSVLLAKEMGITIAGFIRRTNFAVFTHPERIIAHGTKIS